MFVNFEVLRLGTYIILKDWVSGLSPQGSAPLPSQNFSPALSPKSQAGKQEETMSFQEHIGIYTRAYKLCFRYGFSSLGWSVASCRYAGSGVFSRGGVFKHPDLRIYYY